MGEGTKVVLQSLKGGTSSLLEIVSQDRHESSSGTPFWSLEALLHSNDQSKNHSGEIERLPRINIDESKASYNFLRGVPRIGDADSEPEATSRVRFLFPSEGGFIARSDFLEQRFACCEHVVSVKSFLSPLQSIDHVPDGRVSPSSLEAVLHHAFGAVQLQPTTTLAHFQKEVERRLNYTWVLPTPISRRRIAWVQGREDIDCIQRALDAAIALGVNLVVMDERGHWLQDENSPWAHYREAFVELDITADPGLPERVVNAVRSYPEHIDGIVTISDVRLPLIARACRILDLPTESPEAYDIAGDKGRTRMLEVGGPEESFVLGHADELDAVLAQRKQEGRPPPSFPLIVKPVIGWCSDCVSKASSDEELRVAVRKASDRHANSPTPSTTVVVEPYIDGPEVDANFMLLDGEILFCDINDDFPSPADDSRAGFQANFQETQNVMPTALPASEVDTIREQLRDSIVRQGFRSGAFHAEARVRNSSVQYVAKEGGVVDLAVKETPSVGEPQTYVHEINARPPGYLESVAVMLAYGVDYYAMRMLLAIGDSEKSRLRSIAQPFSSGPQFHLSVMIIQQTRAGIMKTKDAAKEWLDKHPEAKENVVDYYTRKKGGDILEGPTASALWWIAFFSVISRASRRDLLERVEFVQQTFDYEIEETIDTREEDRASHENITDREENGK